MFKHFKLNKRLSTKEIESDEPIEYTSQYINTDRIITIDDIEGNGKHPYCQLLMIKMPKSEDGDVENCIYVIGSAKQLAFEIDNGIREYIEWTEEYDDSIKDGSSQECQQ